MNSAPTFKHIFGPVASRRFGLSLGVDLTPFKTCSFDCRYCQLGATTFRTLERREWVEAGEVLDELNAWKRGGGGADFVSLAGSGEPTLHTRFGDVLRWARDAGKCRSALLTNGTLLWLPEVRRDAAEAHVVKVTLSAWDQASFSMLHRPHPELRFDRVADGIRAFRGEFAGELWLEVFAARGYNASAGDMRRIAAIAATIRPDRIHLNTAVRPTAESGILPISSAELEAMAGLFTPRAEVVASFKGAAHRAGAQATEADILGMIRRHPSGAADVAQAFGITLDAAERALAALKGEGRIRGEMRGAGRVFSAK